MKKSEFLMSPSPRFPTTSAARELPPTPGARVGDRWGRDPVSPVSPVEEETLVIDARSGQSPAALVESKLTRKLQETSLPVSHLQMRGLLRAR